VGCLSRLCEPGRRPAADGVRPGGPPAAPARVARALGQVPARGRGRGPHGPRSDGSLIVAAAGRLFTVARAGALRPFARGPDGLLDRDRARALYRDGRR